MGCSSSDTVSVSINSLPVVDLGLDIEVCEDNIIVLSSGEFESYLWSNASTDSTITIFTSGEYYVDVIDSLGCTNSDTINVVVNPLPIIELGADQEVCEGISVTLDAGEFESYLWSSGLTDSAIVVTSSGEFYVDVIDSLGCTNSDTISVVVNPLPIVDLGQDQEVCEGISVIIEAGEFESYLWSNGSTDSAISVSNSGYYYVDIIDSLGCTNSDSITVVVNSLPIIELGPDQEECDGNSITLDAGQGYNYLWTTLDTTQTIIVTNSDTYYVTITDGNNCSAVDSIIILINPNPVVNIDSVVNISCFGLSDGSATAEVSTGTSPYNYLWSNGDDTEVLNGVAEGLYSVIITDDANCQAYDTITLAEPTLLMMTDSYVTGDCGFSNGSASVFVVGGTSPYLYQWDSLAENQTDSSAVGIDMGTYTVTITDNNGCTSSTSIFVDCNEICTASISDTMQIACFGDSTGSATALMNYGVDPLSYIWNNGDTTAQIINLFAGNYIVTITDSIGCSAISAVTISEPTIIVSNVLAFDANCFGSGTGSAVVSATGGTGSLSFIWSTGGVTNDTITDLFTGVYTVIITDDNICQTIDSVEISQPESLNANLTIMSDITCYGLENGSASYDVTGGILPYTYFWSNGESTQTAENLISGLNSITVVDANNCTLENSFTLIEPESLDFESIVYETSCIDADDGMISLLAGNGTSPYYYEIVSQENGNTVGTDTLTTDLASGYYDIIISDSNNCELLDELFVPMGENECIIIPNAFTPNGDNANDTWSILGIQFYKFVTIEIYNRWGDKLFFYEGTGMGYYDIVNQWDGIYKGKDLPHGSYLYIVDIHNNKVATAGVLLLLR